MEVLDYTVSPDYWTVYLGEDLLTLEKAEDDCITWVFTSEEDALQYCNYLAAKAQEDFSVHPISLELIHEKNRLLKSKGIDLRLRFVVAALEPTTEGKVQLVSVLTLTDTNAQST